MTNIYLEWTTENIINNRFQDFKFKGAIIIGLLIKQL